MQNSHCLLGLVFFVPRSSLLSCRLHQKRTFCKTLLPSSNRIQSKTGVHYIIGNIVSCCKSRLCLLLSSSTILAQMFCSSNVCFRLERRSPHDICKSLLCLFLSISSILVQMFCSSSEYLPHSRKVLRCIILCSLELDI